MTEGIEATLPTKFGTFKIKTFESEFPGFPHLALFTNDYSTELVVDVRIHSECMTGDVFGSTRCDCGDQLDFAMRWVQDRGGVIIYLRQEGRGIGLVNKLAAYNLQEDGLDTQDANLELGFHADERSYEVAIQILEKLGVTSIRLLTNNPEKLLAFEGSGIEVLERIPIEIAPQPDNAAYLKTKKERMGHLISNAF
ncbi:MAG: GTP cyclohydrolase II [Bacteroidota bacterium]